MHDRDRHPQVSRRHEVLLASGSARAFKSGLAAGCLFNQCRFRYCSRQTLHVWLVALTNTCIKQNIPLPLEHHGHNLHVECIDTSDE